jgi:hypothetical protein
MLKMIGRRRYIWKLLIVLSFSRRNVREASYHGGRSDGLSRRNQTRVRTERVRSNHENFLCWYISKSKHVGDAEKEQLDCNSCRLWYSSNWSARSTSHDVGLDRRKSLMQLGGVIFREMWGAT